MFRPDAGFTLIELMIAVTIIGILGAFVYPLYNDYVKRAYRAQIVVLLSEQSQSLERFYTKNGLYSGMQELSEGNEHYNIASNLADHGFVLSAIRKQGFAMATDPCGDFTLTHTGLTSITQAAPNLTPQQCWGR